MRINLTILVLPRFLVYIHVKVQEGDFYITTQCQVQNTLIYLYLYIYY